MTRRARTGQPLSGSIKADDWSDMLQMLQEWRGKQQGFGVDPSSYQQSQTVIWVKNNTPGVSFRRFGPVGFRTVATETQQIAQDAYRRGDPTLVSSASIRVGSYSGAVWDAGTDANDSGRFGIAIEPIPEGGIGRIVVAGVTPAYVYGLTDGHDFCDVEAGNYTSLRSGYRGSAEMITQLFDDSPTATTDDAVLVLVRLGAGARPPEALSITGSQTLSTSWQDIGGTTEGTMRGWTAGPTTSSQWQKANSVRHRVYFSGVFRVVAGATDDPGITCRVVVKDSGGSVIGSSDEVTWFAQHTQTAALAYQYQFTAAGQYFAAQAKLVSTPTVGTRTCAAYLKAVPIANDQGAYAE